MKVEIEFNKVVDVDSFIEDIQKILDLKSTVCKKEIFENVIPITKSLVKQIEEKERQIFCVKRDYNYTIDKAVNEINQKNKEIAELEKQRNELSEILRKNKHYYSDEVNFLRKENEKLKKKNEELLSSMNRLQNDFDNMEMHNAILDEEKEELIFKIKTMMEKNCSLKEEQENCKEYISDFVKSFTKLITLLWDCFPGLENDKENNLNDEENKNEVTETDGNENDEDGAWNY